MKWYLGPGPASAVSEGPGLGSHGPRKAQGSPAHRLPLPPPWGGRSLGECSQGPPVCQQQPLHGSPSLSFPSAVLALSDC